MKAAAPSARILTVILREIRALRAVTERLARGVQPAPPPSAAPVAAPPAEPVRPAPVERITIVAYGGLTGFRELVLGHVRLPLNPQEYLLLHAMAIAPRGKYIEVPDLLDEVAALRANFAPPGSTFWADCKCEDIHRLISKLRKRLAPHGLRHLLETCPCPRGGYRLNALMVSISQGEAGR